MRNYINIVNESVRINEAWQQQPGHVRNDVESINKELNKLDEATLQPAQIQSIFQSLIATRGEGGDNLQVAKKVKAQLVPLFGKITGNPKLNALLSKVGNAVPIEGIKKMVATLPEPAGSKATQIVSQINAGAKQIQDDQDLAAFKGLMLTLIGIGLGAAGAGGPALLGIMGTTAIFRTFDPIILPSTI